MRPLSQRMFDVYRLHQRYRYELWGFQFGGMLLALFLVGSHFYDLRFTLSASTVTAAPTGPASPASIALALVVVVGACVGGVLLGSVLHAGFLTLSRRLSWRDAVGATLLSQYPKSWFR